MKKYSRKLVSYFPQQVIFLGYLFIVYGIFSLTRNDFKGIAFILIGISLSFTTVNISIDFENLLYKEYLNIFGLPYGKWKKLPNYKYITVYNETISQTIGMQSITQLQSNTSICLDLVINKEEKIRLGFFEDKEDAFKTGTFLAEKLNTKLVDYTNKYPHWIED